MRAFVFYKHLYMNLATQKLKDNIEHIIDALGVNGTVQLIINVCNEKAEHINESYNDKAAANTWSNDARQLEKAKRFITH